MMAAYRMLQLCVMLVVACCSALTANAGLCGELAISSETQPTQEPVATPLAIGALPNAYRLHERVISGGQPDGAAGYQALRELGVRTLISVDGAKPDLALANKYGLRYVHLPHGYDGIPEQRGLELAKAISELPGPIYIHCHHGKHRSPAASAVACIGVGWMTREAGVEFLRLAGTNPDYRGLHQVVATAERHEGLDRLNVVFRETADVPSLASDMVQLERTFDHLKQIERAGWQALASNPDVTPVHETLLLREHFTELLRADEARARPLAFREILEHSRQLSESLERQFREPDATRPPTDAARSRLSASLSAIGNDCVQCHRAHRD